MIKRVDDILVGDRIMYMTGTPLAWDGMYRHGQVVANPISDPYTALLWLPTRPDDAPRDADPTWVRHDRVVEVVTERQSPQ
jgi:hypothetical protein